jgi:hypothetical protein
MLVNFAEAFLLYCLLRMYHVLVHEMREATDWRVQQMHEISVCESGPCRRDPTVSSFTF